MTFFDLNVALGRPAHPAGGAFDAPANLRTELERLGIDQALVYSQVAAEADLADGSAHELIDVHGRSHPQTVLEAFETTPEQLRALATRPEFGSTPLHPAQLYSAIGPMILAWLLSPRKSGDHN